MNKVTIYRYDENKPVRTLNLNGEPWFVLRDVCEVLGLGNSRMVADRLDEDEKGVSQIYTLGGVQNATIISESGLYNVILRSDKPEAKPFRKWVTAVVLPSIRKNGGYIAGQEVQNKFDVVFGDMRDEVDKWAQEYSDAIGRNKNDIKTYLADQQNLLVGFGMTRQAGAEMAEQMTSLALDLASFGNMDETASVNAMTKAVMGESEAAKTLGAVLNDSTRAQAMATLGLKGTYDKLDQLTKMQVNYQAILQQSPDAIGDCQRSLDSYESTKKRYIAKLKEIKTIVGQFFLPTYQKILSIGAKGLTMIRDWLQKLTDLTDKLGGSQRVLSVLAAAFTAMLVAMNLKKIGAAITGFTKLARAIGLGHGKALAFFAVFLLLALVIEDFISFMRGDKSLLGTMLERAGVDCEKLRQNIVGVWTKIKQAIGYIGEGIRNVVVPIFEGIRTAAVVALEEIQQAVAKVAPGIAQFFKELSSGKVDKKKWTDIGESIGKIAVGVVAVIAAVKGISAIFGVITTVISVVKAVISVIKLAFVVVKSIITVIKVVGAVISVLASAFGPVILAIAAAIAIGVLLWKNWDKIREAAGNLLEGIKTTIGNVRDAIVTGIQAAIDWITSLPAEALKWGSDIIDGIVSGIQSAVGRVGEAVKGVADKIKSFLGFSEPEDGPLSDFHTYMPDMIDLMASGITSGKKKVKDALEGMTGEMSVIAKANVVSKATGRGATGRTTGGRTVTQNVNINNQFNGDRAGQQKSSEAMDKAAGDATGEMARALAFAK